MDEGNSLAFFTVNHSKHDSQWRMTGESISVVCVACLVELLENSDVRHIRKRKALREVIFLLSRDHKLSDLLIQNTKVAIHLCGILIELLAADNDLLTDAAIEGLVMIAIKHCSENQVVEIVEKLESTIIELNNVRKSHPYVAVLGRLLNSIPALSHVAVKNSVFLDYTISNVQSLAEDKIQVALVFLVLQICANNICLESLNLQIKQRICKEICAVLCSSSNSDVQATALGVLKCFSKQRDVLNCVLWTPGLAIGNCSMLEGFKKLLLSSHVAIQAGGIQCISEILRNDSHDSTYTAAFLKSGIGEMLLEDLETSSDIILGSAFCCLDQIVRSKIFYSDGYAAYGIESMILGVSNSIKLKIPEIIRQGFHIVSMVLASQTEGVPLFSNEGLYNQCAMVLHQGLKSADHRVLIQAGCAVEHFLRPVYLPPSAGLDAIVPLFKTVVAQMQKLIKPEQHLRKIAKGLAEELMTALLRVTDKTFTFVEEYKGRKPSYEVLLTQTSETVFNDNEGVDEFAQLLWQAIDQTCVPALMANYESIENPAVFHSFFAILLRSIAPQSAHRKSFARKLASGSFVRLSLDIKERFCRSEQNKDLTNGISVFLVQLCLALRSDADREIELKTFLSPRSSCVINSVSACLALLAQSSVQQNTSNVIDEALFDAQCLAIELLYISFAHEAEFVRAQDLVASLCKYLVFHPDLCALPRVTLRNLLYLWVTCFDRCTAIPLPTASGESIRAAKEIVVQGLLKLNVEEFTAIKIHNAQFICWLFCQEPLAQMFGRDALLCFLRTEAAQKQSECQMLHRLLMTNLTSFRTLMSLIAEDEDAVVNHVSKTLEALINVSCDLPELRSMSSYVGEILHKLFLSNKTKPLQQHSTSAMLDILIAFQTKLPVFNQDIKLLYHVVNILTTPDGSQRVSVSAFNYLNIILAWNMHGKDPGIAALLLSNKAFCSCVQEVLNTFLVKRIVQKGPTKGEVSLLATVLVLIAYLVLFQRHMAKDVDDIIVINKTIMISLVNQHHNVLGLASLVLWDAIFRSTMQEKTKSLVVFSDNAPGTEEVPVILSETDHQLFFIYLQNCMVHDSETVRQCAVKCFESFLDYVTDAGSYASNPWNRIVLESQLGLLSLDVVTSSLVQLCVLILRHAPGDLEFLDALKSTLNAIISRIPSIPSSEEELSWHCLALLEQAQNCADHRLSAHLTNGTLVWLKRFQESLSVDLSCSPEHARCIEFCSVGDLIVAKNLLMATVPRDPEVLSKLLSQLEEGSKEDSLEQRLDRPSIADE